MGEASGEMEIIAASGNRDTYLGNLKVLPGAMAGWKAMVCGAGFALPLGSGGTVAITASISSADMAARVFDRGLRPATGRDWSTALPSRDSTPLRPLVADNTGVLLEAESVGGEVTTGDTDTRSSVGPHLDEASAGREPRESTCTTTHPRATRQYDK